MKLHTLTTELTTDDGAEALLDYPGVGIIDHVSGIIHHAAIFPDRTPHNKLLAIADAINAALAAAREIEGAGRD